MPRPGTPACKSFLDPGSCSASCSPSRTALSLRYVRRSDDSRGHGRCPLFEHGKAFFERGDAGKIAAAPEVKGERGGWHVEKRRAAAERTCPCCGQVFDSH